MALLLSESEVWRQIDVSESYLVCSMFEEAASKSASIIRDVRRTAFTEEICEVQVDEIVTSAGMVFVQSLKELGRYLEFRSYTVLPPKSICPGILNIERANLDVDMLRRLQSSCFAQVTSSSSGRGTVQTDVYETGSSDSFREAIPTAKKLHRATSNRDKTNPTASNFVLPTIMRISSFFWWCRSVHLKLGNLQLVFPHGKIMFLGILVFLSYIIQKRSAVIKRIVTRQASSVIGGLVDAWRLAFSVQVNPLAAVQQLPTPRGSR